MGKNAKSTVFFVVKKHDFKASPSLTAYFLWHIPAKWASILFYYGDIIG